VQSQAQHDAFHSRDNSVSNNDTNGTGGAIKVVFVVCARQGPLPPLHVGMGVAPKLLAVVARKKCGSA
jgi:hypothetical protein